MPQLQGCRRPRQLQLVQASIFGVGAPEAILVGVVALLVFGPKGLAQVGQLQVSHLDSKRNPATGDSLSSAKDAWFLLCGFCCVQRLPGYFLHS